MTDRTDAWQRLSTPEVSDALDSLGVVGAIAGIRAVKPGLRLLGSAYTVRYRALPGGNVGDFLDDVTPGAVVVIDNHDRVDCTVWGGIMSEAATARGIAGTVIAGACRDTPVAGELGYPLFATAVFMRTGKDRVQLDAVQEPVSLGGVAVAPGDLVLGDGDGVVVVPAGVSDEVLERALQTQAAEHRVVERLRRGEALAAARRAEGYHALQRRNV